MFENINENEASNKDEISVKPTFENQPESSNEAGAVPLEGKPNPFDPARLRLNQDFATSAGVKKLLTTVPVKKPDKQWFFRVRPGEEWRLSTFLLEIKEDREEYLVDPSLIMDIGAEVVPKTIFTAVNRQGVPFLWPIRMPGEDGRQMEWHRSAFEAAERAQDNWVRMQANMSLGAYDISIAQAELAEPTWPEVDFAKLLEVAFRDRFITSLDHPVLKRLRGEF